MRLDLRSSGHGSGRAWPVRRGTIPVPPDPDLACAAPPRRGARSRSRPAGIRRVDDAHRAQCPVRASRVPPSGRQRRSASRREPEWLPIPPYPRGRALSHSVTALSCSLRSDSRQRWRILFRASGPNDGGHRPKSQKRSLCSWRSAALRRVREAMLGAVATADRLVRPVRDRDTPARRTVRTASLRRTPGKRVTVGVTDESDDDGGVNATQL